MVKKDELYVSITPELYKQNKSQILRSQADFLKILKHLHNIKIIRKQKTDLKERLHKLFSNVLKNMELIKSTLPTPTIPKTIHSIKEEEKETFHPKKSQFDEELLLIKEKLRELNS